MQGTTDHSYNIVAGFKKTGIYPINYEIFTDDLLDQRRQTEVEISDMTAENRIQENTPPVTDESPSSSVNPEPQLSHHSPSRFPVIVPINTPLS